MHLLFYAVKAVGKSWIYSRLTLKSAVMSIFILTCIYSPLQAQKPMFSVPSWWFGAAGGANFNFHSGTNQQLNSGYITPVAFKEGNGTGLFLAPLLEFHHHYSNWGFMLQGGYDNRPGHFEEVVSSCNCPADLNAKLSYISIEPSLRFAPFKSNFYLYAGPRIGFIWDKSYTFQQGINPATPEQTPNTEVKGDFDNIENVLVSMQIGAGYDIPISSQTTKTQLVFSPFIAYHPYFGQSPRSTETWELSTLRVGAALKFGQGRAVPPISGVVVPEPGVRFSVNAPANIPAERNVREIFPLRNYVFFDLESTEIPERYVMLRKDQVNDFKEDQVDLFTPKNMSGRSNRQMVVYYNVLNILGDRMGKNPDATIRLVGSSEKGMEDGLEMAKSIQRYLIAVFGIDAPRITVEGRDKPKNPSEQPGATLELDRLREGDRRVSIESNSPALLAEFQSGPKAQLRPVEINARQTAPPDSYVSFVNEGANEAFKSWSLEIKDDKGKVQNFGPYTSERVTIPGKSILGDRPEGTYNVTMKGITQSGNVIQKSENVKMVLWTPATTQVGMRFSVIFEFDESNVIPIYEKYLTEVLTPKIPQRATVIIHGHTDNIGDEAHNQKLSLARANDVHGILKKSLATAGRSDVNFEVYGFGEDERLSPFENKYPEERFYNRTVVIDIIPVN